MKLFWCTVFIIIGICSCKRTEIVGDGRNIHRASVTLQKVFENFSSKINNDLFYETYPFNKDYGATYLSNPEQTQSNYYAYLWPFSGGFSALVAIYESSKSEEHLNLLKDRVLPGLEMYFDTLRSPYAYSSYINSAPLSDRFYDDNIWLGIDFAELYLLTLDEKYLEKSELIWQFIESGADTILGGGIYWCEQKKDSKNTCSNAPGSVYALKLFNATNDSSFLLRGKELYEWTKNNLQDTTDFLYFDNIKLSGNIGKSKYAYNSGQMIQAASLLYKHTGEESYLEDAQRVAGSSYQYFFGDVFINDEDSIRLIRKGDVWFTAVMLRGFIELYQQDKNHVYIDEFLKNLDYAWVHMRDKNGLFNSDWSGQTTDSSKWLLTQFAMSEMYARIDNVMNK